MNTLNPGLDVSRLEKIAISGNKKFSVNANMKDLEVITPHPSGSYEIKAVAPNSLQITVIDPEKFWEISNCPVIAY